MIARSATLFLGWLLAHVALRYLCEAFWLDRPIEYLPAAFFLCAVCAWWAFPRLREGREILGAVAGVKLLLLATVEFPDFANHSMLETLLFLLGAAAPGRADLPRAALRTAAAVMVWAALTKIAQGSFLSGAFFHWYASMGGALSALFSALGVPPAPLEGPWLPSHSAPSLLAWATVMAELALGLGLLALRGGARRALFPLGACFILAIEIVAGEWWFGLLVCALMAFDGLWERRWVLPAFFVADALLVFSEVGLRFSGGGEG